MAEMDLNELSLSVISLWSYLSRKVQICNYNCMLPYIKTLRMLNIEAPAKKISFKSA